MHKCEDAFYNPEGCQLSITIQKFPPINIQFFPVWRAKSGVLIGPFALLEPVRIVAGFQDIAVVGDAVK